MACIAREGAVPPSVPASRLENAVLLYLEEVTSAANKAILSTSGVSSAEILATEWSAVIYGIWEKRRSPAWQGRTPDESYQEMSFLHERRTKLPSNSCLVHFHINLAAYRQQAAGMISSASSHCS